MINLKDYPLTYFRKSDMRTFHVKRICGSDYVIVDSVTFEKLYKTQHFLRKEFVSDKEANLDYVKKKFDETA